MATVKKQMPETEAFLEKVVNINSGSLNKEGVRQVGKLMADEFEKLGFKTEWVTLPDSLNRAGHLVATRQGKKGKETLSDRAPGHSIRKEFTHGALYAN